MNLFIRTFSIQSKLQMANISSEYYPFRAENPPEQNCGCKIIISNNLLNKLVIVLSLDSGAVAGRSACEINPVDFQVRPTEALSSHHYLCSCTQELWVLLMHLVEHRNKVLHRRVTQQRSLSFAHHCVMLSRANAAPSPTVFLELRELAVEAPGFGGAGGGGVQRAPHPLQGPSRFHVVAGHPLGHAGAVLSKRDAPERGEKKT